MHFNPRYKRIEPIMQWEQQLMLLPLGVFYLRTHIKIIFQRSSDYYSPTLYEQEMFTQ